MLLFVIQIFTIPSSAYYYYTSHGNFNNSCKVQSCQICNTLGTYRQNCSANSHTDPGTCVSCTGLPNGGLWTTHGWFNNSCSFECEAGYFKNNSLCYVAMAKVTLAAVLEVPQQLDEFNRTAFILALAKASNCSTCTSLYTDPAICGFCKIFVNNVTRYPA